MLQSPPHTEESYSHFLPSNIFNWHIFYCTLHIIFFLASWSASDKQKRPGNQKSQLVSYFISERGRSCITSACIKRSPVGFSSWNTSRNNCPSCCSICVPVFSISPGLLFTLLFVSGHRTNTAQEGATGQGSHFWLFRSHLGTSHFSTLFSTCQTFNLSVRIYGGGNGRHVH